MTSGGIVKLNIGGAHFQTSVSTLIKFDGFFKTMLVTGVPIARDESGAIFIDRDSAHFRSILNYMRDGRLNLPESSKAVKDIQDEARYYLLGGLVQLCATELQQRAAKSVPVGSDLKILESKKEYFEVIVNAVKPTLVIYCPLVKGAVTHPKDFKLKQFLRQYGNRLDIYIRPYENMPFKKDFYPDLWSWSLHFNENSQNYKLESQGSIERHLTCSIENFLIWNRPA